MSLQTRIKQIEQRRRRANGDERAAFGITLDEWLRLQRGETIEPRDRAAFAVWQQTADERRHEVENTIAMFAD